MQALIGTVTTLIALIALFIAYQQAETNRLRLAYELYDKRFAVYKGAQNFLSDIFRNARLSDSSIDFMPHFQSSRFLFGEEIYLYFDKIYKRATKMQAHHHRLSESNLSPDLRRQVAKDLSEELTWLTDQLPVLAEKMRPYLAMPLLHSWTPARLVRWLCAEIRRPFRAKA